MSKARRRITLEDVQQPLDKWLKFVSNSAGTFVPEDEEWLNSIQSTLAPPHIFDSDRDATMYRLGHYRGWVNAKRATAQQPAQEKSAETTPPTKELSEYGKELWMEEYRRCRNSGDGVFTACKVADNAVQEIMQRMGKQEKPEPVARCADDVVLPDGVFWDGGTLRLARYLGDRELMGEVDGDCWYAYHPDDSDRKTEKGPINTKDDDYYQRGKLMVLRAIDWEAYGLKRPEGL